MPSFCSPGHKQILEQERGEEAWLLAFLLLLLDLLNYITTINRLGYIIHTARKPIVKS